MSRRYDPTNAERQRRYRQKRKKDIADWKYTAEVWKERYYKERNHSLALQLKLATRPVEGKHDWDFIKSWPVHRIGHYIKVYLKFAAEGRRDPEKDAMNWVIGNTHKADQHVYGKDKDNA